MTTKSTDRPVLVIPNLNGGDDLLAAMASLKSQSPKPHVIVVDNASTDGSADKAQQKFPEIELIKHTENKRLRWRRQCRPAPNIIQIGATTPASLTMTPLPATG